MASNNLAVAPADWDQFVGQEKLKRRLLVSIDAALTDLRQMDHILLASEPGFGKTTLAKLIAQEMGDADFTPLMMPIKMKALQNILLDTRGVLFLDELHRLKKKDQEELLLVLEEGYIQLSNGDKIKIDNPLTIIGATTELQDIITPLRERFTHRPKFEKYTDDDMSEIVRRMASRIDLYPTDEECVSLGRASAGVPRQARTITFTARDLGTCNPDVVLETCGITDDGLTEDHVQYMISLEMLGRQAGVDVLSNYTGLPKDILLSLEKLLVRMGYISYTPRGREMTVAGWKRVESLVKEQEEQ